MTPDMAQAMASMHEAEENTMVQVDETPLGGMMDSRGTMDRETGTTKLKAAVQEMKA